MIHRGRSSLFTVWKSDDTTHPDHWWARDHHEPHFALVEGAAARHDDLRQAFRADVGPLDDPKAVEALTISVMTGALAALRRAALGAGYS